MTILNAQKAKFFKENVGTFRCILKFMTKSKEKIKYCKKIVVFN